jgi:hypothetical protein
MNKVIDAGALRSHKLQSYLDASPNNFAVITDYAAMESFKGDPIKNLRLSLRILADNPNRVIVLRSTRFISNLKPRKKGLHSRFIDPDQTRTFPVYCNSIFDGKVPESAIIANVQSKSLNAKQHFNHLRTKIHEIRKGIFALASSYHPSDIKSLRSRAEISAEFSDRITHDILLTTAIFISEIPHTSKKPTFAQVRYSFPFRFALCAYLMSLRWIAEQGFANVQDKKLENDYTDMTYAAYATFYDGLITEDIKLQETFDLARWWLDHRLQE